MLAAIVGAVSGVSGKCPNLSFSCSSYLIVTDKSTKFDRISCGDVKGGRVVEVIGVVDSSGVVHASQVSKVGED